MKKEDTNAFKAPLTVRLGIMIPGDWSFCLQREKDKCGKILVAVERIV
jgi:hypothetical protein